MRVIPVLFLTLCLVTAGRALAANGPAALWVPSATHTPTHWNVDAGVTINAEIRGVEFTPLPPTIPVWVKSSDLGNVQLVANWLVGNTYGFSYTAPTGACNTTVVSYGSIGHNTCNDLIDDGLLNNSSSSAAGFRFIYLGGPMDCSPLPVAPTTWSALKTHYVN